MDCYLKGVFDKFEQIKNTSARTGKEALLRQYEDDEMFKMTLKFLLDPYVVTNVGATKLKKFSSTPIILDGFKEYIEFLINKADGKQSTVNIIMDYINKQDGVYEDFLKDLATKSYKMGLSGKTVNKVYGDGFIPEFNVMLAHPYDEKDLRCRFIVTSKLNGCRLICVVEDGKPLFFTRQGKPMEDMIQLEREMSRYEDGVFDGEALAIGDFVDSDAQYKETIKRSRVKGVKTGLKFVMYDFIELDEFMRRLYKLLQNQDLLPKHFGRRKSQLNCEGNRLIPDNKVVSSDFTFRNALINSKFTEYFKNNINCGLQILYGRESSFEIANSIFESEAFSKKVTFEELLDYFSAYRNHNLITIHYDEDEESRTTEFTITFNE